MAHIAATYKWTGRDSEVTRATRVSDCEGPKRQCELVIFVFANTPGTRAKFYGKQFVPQEGVSFTVGIGVVSDG